MSALTLHPRDVDAADFIAKLEHCLECARAIDEIGAALLIEDALSEIRAYQQAEQEGRAEMEHELAMQRRAA